MQVAQMGIVIVQAKRLWNIRMNVQPVEYFKSGRHNLWRIWSLSSLESSVKIERVLWIFLNCHQTNSSRSWKGPMKKIQLHGRTKTIKMLAQIAAAHFRAQLKDVIGEWNRNIWVLCFLHIKMLSNWNSIKKSYFHDSFSPTFCAHKFKFYWSFHKKDALLFNLNFI